LSLKPEIEPVPHRIMRRINFSAAGVNSMDTCSASLIYTAAANRGTSGLMMHVLGIGQIAAHCGSSKKPMHSVHFVESMKKAKSFSTIASLGHSL
jgi:glycerol-3-phosphate O-acyltransferase